MSSTITHLFGAQGKPALVDELETARLRLRLFSPDDLDALSLITADPEVMRYIGHGAPLTREETERNLMSIIRSFTRRGFGRWAMWHKESQRLIGYCGLSLNDQSVGVEVAYLMARDCWGKGLATEAAKACLRYGFEELQFDRISALTRPANLRSQRVMQLLGMTYLRHGHHYGFDSVHYHITRSRFQLAPAL